MSKQRAPGFYWVKNRQGHWQISEWFDGKWWPKISLHTVTDDAFDTISEKRIPSPPELEHEDTVVRTGTPAR